MNHTFWNIYDGCKISAWQMSILPHNYRFCVDIFLDLHCEGVFTLTRSLSIDTFDSIKRHKSHNLRVHTYSTILRLILFDELKSVFILVIKTKNCSNTSNGVILSIYIHTRSHTIQQKSCVPLIKTNNKPDLIGVLIDKRWQK